MSEEEVGGVWRNQLQGRRRVKTTDAEGEDSQI